MKENIKRVLPFLLVLLFAFAPLALASAPVDAPAPADAPADALPSAKVISAPADAGVIEAVELEHATVTGAHDVAVAHVADSLSHEKLMDLFWRVLNFAVLMAILIKFGAKPIANALSGRQQRVKSEVEDLEARRIVAEKEFRQFEAKLANVEKDIDSIVDKAVAQAEIEKAKILERAEQAAADIQKSAEQAIQNEIANAKRSLKNDAADQAAVMAEELIVKHLTADDQVKIVEDYLAKVGAV
ncbi:F0F1 ATP synthase subunit B family protein [Desulfotalea psychrophila]|uniref:ATP synthase subunit b n=1 Tax=Desulfotalea psychrophila (strain LSv54 / DSM 12343) TaxID=177439 RepID=ATPF_DESPS|nr:ATP synthase F0 subunit B [Desulfotalea psychrophila]Q6AQ14.1 RecName: Full=ATP synthase subunit b; AltName: Full=ATP synthase F(0) sector subunit b; AltName: Full=ATPase subunit I; AltName: Full=F-type ATPase subunit b; Short=F-ATPase subunit b [Desulfotalea psychrophila LSv54]CAG35559.1 probable ATP synthase, subunit b (AtpF) [Desulfotalea psychrophila LSv54]